MKKIETGFIVLFLIGLMFFLFKWPFGSELLIISIGTIALIYMYFGTALFNNISIKNIFKKSSEMPNNKLNLLGGGFLGILLALNIIGSLFKFMNWPFANEMIFISLPLIAIILAISFYLFLKEESFFYKRIISRYFFWSFLSLTLVLLPKFTILEFRFAQYPNYINAVKKYENNPNEENYLKLEKEMEVMRGLAH